MIKNLISKLNNIDSSIIIIIKKIFVISFFICMLSTLILYMYISYPISHLAYLIGLKLFKSSLTIGIAGFICGVSIDFIR